jgi:diphthine-ammonia ligase
MKLAALFSGGKDSTYVIHLAQQAGHQVKYLATIHSKNDASYMYHSINIGLTVIQSQALGIKLVSKESLGEKENEVHDLEVLLKDLEIDGVLCGAIASTYQKTRVEKVCKKLGLKLVAPLWGIKPDKYMQDLIDNNFKVIITGVFAEGLGKEWLGREINSENLAKLKKVEHKHKINLAGEGGEFETAVIDCPLFKQSIQITDSQIHWHKDKTGFLEIKNVKLTPKNNNPTKLKGYA